MDLRIIFFELRKLNTYPNFQNGKTKHLEFQVA